MGWGLQATAMPHFTWLDIGMIISLLFGSAVQYAIVMSSFNFDSSSLRQDEAFEPFEACRQLYAGRI